MTTAADQLSMILPFAGTPITLARTNAPTQTLSAVRGTTKGEIVGADGTLTLFTLADWLIRAADTGELGKPKRGDTVTVVSTGQQYTVAHPDPTARVVSHHGNDDTAWRVHSVKEGNQ